MSQACRYLAHAYAPRLQIRFNLFPCCIRINVEFHDDVVEAVAHIAVDTEDALHARTAVSAAYPVTGSSPLESGSFRCLRQCSSSTEHRAVRRR